MRVAHTADIHIRSLSRHDEYREVFTAFIDDCKKNKVDHIFIGGDIFHTKTSGISPEYIDFLTWWLNAMAEVAPVHLTLGNHDGNLVNQSRQDAVSPIVTAMNNPQVHLYKKSGVYEFHPGFNWCVYSLFDEEAWKDVKPEPGKVNIACYHGAVQGSVTESGWALDDSQINTEFFKDYSYAFLGDIHKMQYLGYRETVSGKSMPWIGYSGTPIQQNYAEDLDHGYLLWDIIDNHDWGVSFKKLPNPKPYVTIQWEGSQSDFLNASIKYPKQSRFRIKSQLELSQDDISFLTQTLKTNLIATEVTFKSEYRVPVEMIKTKSSTIAKSDLASPDTMMDLIQSYCKENGNVNVDWDSISNQIKQYMSVVALANDYITGSKWSLRHLKWDNTFAYGEENEIDFAKLNGIVGVFGPNRTGKSSIVGTLMYSMFNTTDRGSLKNLHVCNVRKPFCYARAVFEHNSKTYITERQTTKSVTKKGITTAATSLNFYRMREDGEVDDLCDDLRTGTEKAIRNLLGTSDDFSLTALSAQGDINAFIYQGSTRRRATISRFLGLDIFDKMYDLSSKDLSVYKSQLKSFPDKNWDELQLSNGQTILNLSEKIDELVEACHSSQNEVSNLRTELSLHKGHKPVTIIDVQLHEQKIKNMKVTCNDACSKIDVLNDEIIVLKDKLKIVEAVESADNIEDLKKKLFTIDSLEKSVLELQHLHDKELVLLKAQQKSLKILDEVPCGDDYPTCKFIKDAHQNKSRIVLQNDNVVSILKKLDNINDVLKKLEKDSLVSKISKIEKANILSSKLNLEISRKETDVEKIRSNCEMLTANLSDNELKLLDLQEALKNDENSEVVSLRTKIETLCRSIKEQDEARMMMATQRGRLMSELEKLDAEKESRDKLLQMMKTYEIISGAFSKKGIPLIITRSQLPVINAELANILHGIVDFTVEMENDDESDATEIYINYGDSKRIIELCSGMEKTIASIALRVALVNISSMSKSDMFIIDEGFGTLDDAGVEACNRLLTSLKKFFRLILVITHVDGIKDVADHILEITKNEKDSKMVFV